MQDILITGGAGFIGSNLAETLLEQGHRVTCLDNFQSGDMRQVEQFENHSNFEIVEHDITEPIPVSLTADQIYNLACPASPEHYQIDPIHTVRTNVLGSLNVLDAATRLGAAVLQASTSEVYGDPAIHPQSEDYWGNVNPIGPRACYNEGKRCAETLFFDYHRRNGTRIKVARIFNTYGPGMRADDGRVVSSFVVDALAGRDLNIFGDGTQTRSFCFVTDMVDGLMRLMNASDRITGPINLGSAFETRIDALAKMVVVATGSTAGVTFKPARENDPQLRRPDLARARAKLGWSATTEIADGLAKTINHFERAPDRRR